MSSQRPDPPPFPRAQGDRGQILESLASATWTILFFSYCSRSLLSAAQASAAASFLCLAIPPLLAGLPGVLERRNGSLRTLILYLIYALLPSSVLFLLPKFHLAALVILIIPPALNLLPPSLSATGSVSIWPMLICGLSCLHAFCIASPLTVTSEKSPVGFSFRFDATDIASMCALSVVAVFCMGVAAMAVGFGSFIRPRELDGKREGAMLLGLYINALVEEAVFRGATQQVMTDVLKGPIAGGFASATVFGLSFLLKEKQGFRAPNWRYSVVTFVIGVCCAAAWHVTRKITTTAFVHAASVYVLKTAFRKPTAV